MKLEGYGNLTTFENGNIKYYKRGFFVDGKLKGYSQQRYSTSDFLEGFMYDDKRHGFS